MLSNPNGVAGAKNDDTFKEAILKRWAFYKRIGIQSMNILSKEITLLDELHAIVKIHWKSSYRKSDGSFGTIEFDVIYIVQLRSAGIKIFAYITGDEQKHYEIVGQHHN